MAANETDERLPDEYLERAERVTSKGLDMPAREAFHVIAELRDARRLMKAWLQLYVRAELRANLQTMPELAKVARETAELLGEKLPV